MLEIEEKELIINELYKGDYISNKGIKSEKYHENVVEPIISKEQKVFIYKV